MPIDASIYGQVQQPQQVNPLASLAQAYQIKAYAGAADKSERETAQQNRLLQLVQSPEFTSAPAQQRAQLLESQGLFDQAGKVITNNAAANKDQRAAEVSGFELQSKKLEMLSNLAGSVTDQPSYDRARTIAQQQGLDVSQWNPQYDPAGVAQFAQATLTAKERLNAQIQQQAQGVTVRGQDLSAETARRGQDISSSTTIRGQDLTDSRSREANQNGRVPSGYRQAGDGSLEFIPGGPADPNTKPAGGKPLNDTQAKALQFGSRMQQAEEVFTKLAEEGVNASVPGSRTPVIGSVISALQPEARQELDQAKRNFINAVLRRESGAAIAPSEFDNADKQYFAQPGDSPKVREQKKANRELATRGILAEVPDSENRVSQVRGTPAKPAGGATRKVIGGKTYENDGKGWYAVN